MKLLLNGSQAKEADRKTIESGFPSLVLMERASLSVVHELYKRGVNAGRTLVTAGTGNNGADGLVIARILCEDGFRPDVLICGDPDRGTEEFRLQQKLLSEYGVTVYYADGSGLPDFSSYRLIIDALFGVGLSREITGIRAEVIRGINESGAYVTAVDIPSGIHAGTGAVFGCAVRADLTVTFAAGKKGLFLSPGILYAGDVAVTNIGIPERMLKETGSRTYVMEETDVRLLPQRRRGGNKGTYGKVLIVAGSREICGAAFLAGKAALRSGAGMVRIHTEENNRTALQASFPEALITVYPDGRPDPDRLRAEIDWADVVLAGPGLSVSDTAYRLLSCILTHCTKPCVLDADALNLLSMHPDLWDHLHAECIITPHMVEMTRLTGKPLSALKEDQEGAAIEFASEKNVTCVLKDVATVVALPDGTSYICCSGNSALATAGSGDVLSGIIAGLMGQYGCTVGCDDTAVPTAAAADLIHGLLGRAASDALSRGSVTASDLTDHLYHFIP